MSYDWVQVVDPQSSHTFFANPTTGECLADRPEEGSIKPTDPSGEWWELWDKTHQRTYYYHTGSSETCWVQPADQPVISLIKIQESMPVFGHGAGPSLAASTSTLITTAATTKRNSRSLDLPSTRQPHNPPTLHHHIRSTSDGATTSASAAAAAAAASASASAKATQSPASAGGVLCSREQSQDSLSAALSNSIFNFKWPRSSSAAKDTDDAGLPHRQRRMSNFSALRTGGVSSWKNLMGRSHTSPRNSIAVSSPTYNQDATESLNPLKNQSNVELNSSHMYSGLQDQTAKPALPTSLRQEINQFAIDGFAKKYFATHKRGLIFRRRVPMTEMLQWTKDSLKQPLIMLNKDLYKDALRCFKLIQIIMGDRPRPRQSSETEEYQSLLQCGIDKGQMRDEIYVQVCKQLHNNPSGKSIRKGWEILCVISVTFPPSKNLESYLTNFVEQNKHVKENEVDTMSQHLSATLKRICARGAKGKVLTAAEIERAKISPFKPSIFDESLETIMSLPVHVGDGLKIPKIVPFLTNAILEMKGTQSEGIFRVPGDAEEVTDLRVRIENGHYNIGEISDPNVPASLLKYWLRHLSEPLITAEHYDACIRGSENAEQAIRIVNSLPDVNRRIVLFMMQFVQQFTDPDVISHTRMNVHNLAMVLAPNFLRCPSESLTTVFENSKYEQAFVKTLITHLDTDTMACAYSDEPIVSVKAQEDGQ